MQLIDLNEKYLDEVHNLEKEAFKCLGWSKENLKREIENSNCIFKLLIDDKNLIGYYSFYKSLDEAYINNIAVSAKYQNLGYGKYICNEMINQAKQLNINAITLEVRVSNLKAIKLYEQLGFKCSGVRPKFYKNTEDAKIYWLNLEG